MKFKSMMAAVAALAMTATPVLAASANPAASLSVATARVGTPTAKKNGFFEGSAGIYALLIVAGVAAIVIVEATKDDSPDSP